MITLQPVTQENYNACLALERTQFDFVGDAAAVLANAYIYRDSSLAYAIYDEDTAIGMVLLDETGNEGSYEFTDLFIADNYRNQGYGDKTVKAILSHFFRKGATSVHMQVHKDNKTAIHVYEKNGFSVKETSPWDEDFVVMEYCFDITNLGEQVKIVPLTPETETAFYCLAGEYLPDSDPAQLKHFQELFPKAFLTLLLDNTVIGVAFGWHRKLQVPEDDSFVLNGIAVRHDKQRKGYGQQLLQAFEQAAKEYGALSVSLGSGGGYVEKFYINCGYTPTEYKVWENGASVVEKRFDTIEDYYSYSRKNEDGFVVMRKKYICTK